MAGKQKKTIFISYRRAVSQVYALAIYQFFRSKRHNVFYDINGMSPGDFRAVLLHQIESRDHFLILLAPGTLDRCHEPGDWLRREIEHAMDTKRNIVPIFIEGFNFSKEEKNLTGKLADLPNYAGQKMDAELFEEIMTKIDKQFLKTPAITSAAQAVSPPEQEVILATLASADAQPPVTQDQLTAEEYLILSYQESISERFNEAITAANEAIKLDPNLAFAYLNRGSAYFEKGEIPRSIGDFTKALMLDPHLANGYYNRAKAYRELRIFDKAISDYTEAIYLDPNDTVFYTERGNAYLSNGDARNAIADYDNVILLDPGNYAAYGNRANAYRMLRDFENAIRDCNEALKINPNYSSAYNNRGIAYFDKGDDRSAIDDFTTAIRLAPTSSRFRNRSGVYRLVGKFAEAEADEREARRLEGENNLD